MSKKEQLEGLRQEEQKLEQQKLESAKKIDQLSTNLQNSQLNISQASSFFTFCSLIRIKFVFVIKRSQVLHNVKLKHNKLYQNEKVLGLNFVAEILLVLAYLKKRRRI